MNRIGFPSVFSAALLAFPAAAGASPRLDGVDVSEAVGAYRMEKPQFGCAMTVYGRYLHSNLEFYTDGELGGKTRRNRGERYRPRFTFMGSGQKQVWSVDRGGEYYQRTLETAVEREAGKLRIETSWIMGYDQAGDEPREYSPGNVAMLLENAETLTLTQNYQSGHSRACRYKKVSASTGRLPPRLLPYVMEYEGTLDGRPAWLRASFRLEEFSEFDSDSVIRDFRWEIRTRDGRTLEPAIPYSGPNWRAERSGWMSAGRGPLKLGVGRPAILSVLDDALNSGSNELFIVELEAGALASIAGGEHVLRHFMSCDQKLERCGLMRSAIDGHDPGFFSIPFPDRADHRWRAAGDGTFELRAAF